MATKEKKIEVIKVNQKITNNYSSLINSASESNSQGIKFIELLGQELANGTTIRDARESMKSVLKDINLKPVVLPTHVEAVSVACLIINKYRAEIESIKVSKILSLSARVLADKKASGAKSHVEAFKSFDELDTKTKTKAESQAEAKSTKPNVERKQAKVNIAQFLKVSAEYARSTKPAESLDAEAVSNLKLVMSWMIALDKAQALKPAPQKVSA